VTPTDAQAQYWLLDQLAPGSAVGHVGCRIRIDGPFDLHALRRTVGALVRRHQVLQLGLHPRPAELPAVTLADHAVGPLAIHDLEGLPIEVLRARADDIVRQELCRPFDLSRPPLLRCALVLSTPGTAELLLVAHRAAADEDSVIRLAREVVDGYPRLADGGRPEETFEPFTPFAVRQRTGEADLEYWRTLLADLPDPLDLPHAAPRGSELSLAAGTVSRPLDPQLFAGLARVAAREATTTYVAMMTGLAILLHRYTQRQTLVLGALTDHRDYEAPDAVGPYAEPTVLRLELPYDPTPVDVLRLVRGSLADAAAHPATFRQILAAAAPERQLGLHPLFQVRLAPRPDPVPPVDHRGARFAVELLPPPEQRYDLDLRYDASQLQLTFAADMFTEQAGLSIVDDLLIVLGQLARSPDTHLSNLSLLDAARYDLVVREWNQTTVPFPGGHSLAEIFEEQARRTPDALALRWEERQLTYRQLSERSDRLAHYLRALGVGFESGVGLYFGYTMDWVIGALATLKAGGYYVPLDPAYPPSRLEAMCEDAAIRVLLLPHELDGDLAYTDAVRARVEDAERAADLPDGPVPITVDPDQLAYIMFTSGSTGRPKAIGVTHRNIARTVCGTSYVDFRSTDVMGQASNISFDAATWEVWGALLNGMPLVGLRKSDVLDAERLKTVLRDNAITIFFLPAALMKQIVSQVPDAFGSLRHLFSGGEQADLHTLRRMLRHGPPDNLINPYGPTETTVFAIVYRANDMPADETYVPIGFPIENTTAYILDMYLRPVPPGVIGDLYVGGPGVARGYVGQPDLTASRFVADPFSGDPTARLYQTGDLARYRPDGTIDFLGRADRQVKIRGFRVEPAEVESSLLASGMLREVSVQVGLDRSGDQVLVAYVIPAGEQLDVEKLREFARVRLPVYMVPSSFVVLSAFPLNANGKLDARALVQQAQPGAADDSSGLSATELRLAEVWRSVLNRPVTSAYANFFALGGDSLAAYRMTIAARAVFGADLALDLAFRHMSLAGLAEAIDRTRRPGPPAAAVDPEPAAAVSAVAPASGPVLGETAERMLAIWREVLEVPDLGVDDDFFDHGGHSLKVTRVTARVRSSFGWQVPVSVLFENRTVNRFTAALESTSPEAAG
jgi:amino acid adenylation domain-containing protein